MVEKACCIAGCTSSTESEEHRGVTFHKFPSSPAIHTAWCMAARCEPYEIDKKQQYICSRHFRKVDFQNLKDSKFILRQDAVPTIFPWGIHIYSVTEEPNMADEAVESTPNVENNTVPEPKEVIEEVIDLKPTHVEDATLDQKEEETEADFPNKAESNILGINKPADTDMTDINMDSSSIISQDLQEIPKPEEPSTPAEMINNDIIDIIHTAVQDQSSVMSVIDDSLNSSNAASVIETFLNQSKGKHSSSKKKKTSKAKKKPSSSDKGTNGSMALTVGSKVEAKDFHELWHPAQIMEVDYEDMEVLVHYENVSQRHDEWIHVSSPRLRPLGSTGSTGEGLLPSPGPKPITFKVGERCLARWSDNRRFPATVRAVLDNGRYEIIFDDGFIRLCKWSTLFKVKQPSEPITQRLVDSPRGQTPAPQPVPYGSHGFPHTEVPNYPIPNLAPYHKHLFDPTRDYLGSKSERREMKRKLNVKALFNIGQSKRNVKKSKKKVIVKKEIKQEIKEEIQEDICQDLGVEHVKVEAADQVKMPEEISQKEIEDAKPKIIDSSDVKEEPVTSEEGTIENEAEEASIKEEGDLTIENQSEESSVTLEEQVKEQNPVVPVKILESSRELRIEISPLETKAGKYRVKPSSGAAKELHFEAEGDITVLNDEQSETSSEALKDDSTFEDTDLRKDKKPPKPSDDITEERILEIIGQQKSQLKPQSNRHRRDKHKLSKTPKIQLKKAPRISDGFLGEGEWCCRWVDGQPQGVVSELEYEAPLDSPAKNMTVLPRRSVQVEDNRLPTGWSKHMVRRSHGHSAGKWDVVLVNPEDRRFRTKHEMRAYFESSNSPDLKHYESVLQDFGVHRKLSKRLGWDTTTEKKPEHLLATPAILSSSSPIAKRRKLTLKKKEESRRAVTRPVVIPNKKKKLGFPTPNTSLQSLGTPTPNTTVTSNQSILDTSQLSTGTTPADTPLEPLEDGYVWVGSMKVQIIENLLRCPVEGCYKNFRKDNLLRMHIKHYHKEMRKMLGLTPKVLDLAYARATTDAETPKLKIETDRNYRAKIPKAVKKEIETFVPKVEPREIKTELHVDTNLQCNTGPVTPNQLEADQISTLQDSPKLRSVLESQPRKAKVLYSVKKDVKKESYSPNPDLINLEDLQEETEDMITSPPMDAKDEPGDYMDVFEEKPSNMEDFEAAISTHTVTKGYYPTKLHKKRKSTGVPAKPSKKKRHTVYSEEESWEYSDHETRSSYGTPDSKELRTDAGLQPATPASENMDNPEPNTYITTETGERIKIVHMKREEIINCACGFPEEDGLMIQCDLCLCWQHGICFGIERDAQVPDKYVCSICRNPRRGRRSKRFLNDQDMMYEGLLAGARPNPALRRAHELSGNLLRLADSLHALKVKYQVATKKDHPKLYLWATDWERSESQNDIVNHKPLNHDYVDLNAMITEIGKTTINKDVSLGDFKAPPVEDVEGFQNGHDAQLGSQALLANLLGSPGGASLDLPISTSDLEKLAKSVQESELVNGTSTGPEPEAAIDNAACRERLLAHLQRCQAHIDARLDSIEAQVAELESQDPSFEDDETAEYFPRTKQTIQMLVRDLATMEELGHVT